MIRALTGLLSRSFLTEKKTSIVLSGPYHYKPESNLKRNGVQLVRRLNEQKAGRRLQYLRP